MAWVLVLGNMIVYIYFIILFLLINVDGSKFSKFVQGFCNDLQS